MSSRPRSRRPSTPGGLSYKAAGVDIAAADAAKEEMARSIDVGDQRVLNRVGAFASLVEGRFPGLRHPVLVLKTEEPGSKQKLAFQHGRVESIACDLINHLINDIIVMGADPLYVQDCIICGRMEPAVVRPLVAAMAAACREQGCALVGGETSEQPGVVEAGLYILSASIVGAVEKSRILDGAAIRAGDVVLAAASNGLHTNGYSLVRRLMAANPKLADRDVDGESFLDAVMLSHRCYYQAFRDLFRCPALHGLAHITGGGIRTNLGRILSPGLDASIDLGAVRIPTVFRAIRDEGRITDSEMLRTFNMGVGMAVVCDRSAAGAIMAHAAERNTSCYPIGSIVKGTGKVRFRKRLRWGQ